MSVNPKDQLVRSNQDDGLAYPRYGAVTTSTAESNKSECSLELPCSIQTRIDMNSDSPRRDEGKKMKCSCEEKGDRCHCDKSKKMEIRFEPWARQKTITLVLLLFFLGVWIITISAWGSSL